MRKRRTPLPGVCCPLLLTALLFTPGCLQAEAVQCGDGSLCPRGTECVTLPKLSGAERRCVPADAAHVCEGIVEGQACHFPGEEPSRRYICRQGYCLESECGDGVEDPANPVNPESCDDGNRVSGDGCSPTCTPETLIWRRLAPTEAPPAREGHAMALDLGRRVIVLFGGQRDDTLSRGKNVLDDTWEFDVDEFTWERKVVDKYGVPLKGHPPAPRFAHAMSYDSQRYYVLLFGGTAGSAIAEYFGDTWTFDGKWKLRESLPDSPPPILGHAMAFDRMLGVSVLCGGKGDSAEPASWEWDGAWRMTAGGGSLRSHKLSFFDGNLGQLLRFGGRGAENIPGGTQSKPINKLYAYQDQSWQKIEHDGDKPEPRSEHAMAYHQAADKLIVFSGRLDEDAPDNSAPIVADDFWQWDPVSKWRGEGAWPDLVVSQSGPHRPEPRCDASMVYVPPADGGDDGGYLLLFGGRSGGRADATLLPNDTWIGRFEQRVCGNDEREGSEGCDGDDFGEMRCDSVEGFIGGKLECNPDCTVSFDQCF